MEEKEYTEDLKLSGKLDYILEEVAFGHLSPEVIGQMIKRHWDQEDLEKIIKELKKE